MKALRVQNEVLTDQLTMTDMKLSFQQLDRIINLTQGEIEKNIQNKVETREFENLVKQGTLQQQRGI